MAHEERQLPGNQLGGLNKKYMQDAVNIVITHDTIHVVTEYLEMLFV